MDNQYKRIASGIFLRPTGNEFLGIIVEILFLKWRRVHRVEKLLDLIDENFDPMRRAFTNLEFVGHNGMVRWQPSLRHALFV